MKFAWLATLTASAALMTGVAIASEDLIITPQNLPCYNAVHGTISMMHARRRRGVFSSWHEVLEPIESAKSGCISVQYASQCRNVEGCRRSATVSHQVSWMDTSKHKPWTVTGEVNEH
ncbi:uncharacterized protein EDB91DRAFT_1086114 [Suillus paluster]|uniref:uncharacterized protein n=1 Tax=Suillus paluster TaxID=48578 RepID=UPI001B87807B|nr:uncharacterized protein EDB91DRAFT_1086114 [Suillus paluster]KAG1728390.1 hypothetical protein EDB91DRAFT_1086114 [Suillus paluster]